VRREVGREGGREGGGVRVMIRGLCTVGRREGRREGGGERRRATIQRREEQF